MKQLVLFCWILFLLPYIGIAQESAHFGAAKFAPLDGKKLLIIGQDLGAVGGLSSHSDGYIDNILDHFPAGITTYTDIPRLDGLKTQRNWGAGDIHAQAYVEASAFDNSFLVIGLYIVGKLDGIKDGFFNNKIRELAQWCKGQNRPIFLRIGYEFEGPWNSYGQSSFKAAWQQIVHVFDEEEVLNVAYVWQSAGLNRSDIEKWYPGDEYVNWVGYSYFDGQDMGRSIRKFAEDHDKPIMIAEATPRRQLKSGSPENHWRSWFAPLFETIYGNDRIKALAYINADWEAQSMWTGQGWGDSRVQAVDDIKHSWLAEIGKAPWITASDSLFDILQLQSWLEEESSDTLPAMPTDQIEIRQDTHIIHISSLDDHPIDQVQIWDFNGRLLFQKDQPGHTFQLPLTQFSPGGIVMIVEKQGKRYVEKRIMLRP